MALILSDLGADEILKVYWNNARPVGGNNHTLKLFTNNITPVDTTVAGSFVEAAGGGYVAKTLTNGSWTINTANDPSDATYAQQTWTFTGALTGNAIIYGYYIVDADGTLIHSERLSANMTPATNGDVLNVTPVMQVSKGTPS